MRPNLTKLPASILATIYIMEILHSLDPFRNLLLPRMSCGRYLDAVAGYMDEVVLRSRLLTVSRRPCCWGRHGSMRCRYSPWQVIFYHHRKGSRSSWLYIERGTGDMSIYFAVAIDLEIFCEEASVYGLIVIECV